MNSYNNLWRFVIGDANHEIRGGGGIQARTYATKYKQEIVIKRIFCIFWSVKAFLGLCTGLGVAGRPVKGSNRSYLLITSTMVPGMPVRRGAACSRGSRGRSAAEGCDHALYVTAMATLLCCQYLPPDLKHNRNQLQRGDVCLKYIIPGTTAVFFYEYQ